jgi:hypothetical protein
LSSFLKTKNNGPAEADPFFSIVKNNKQNLCGGIKKHLLWLTGKVGIERRNQLWQSFPCQATTKGV